MAEMKEKYKDVYIPMPLEYSEDIVKMRNDTIREEYPNYLPLNEFLEKFDVKITFDMSDEEQDKLKETAIKSDKAYVDSLGGQKMCDKSVEYMTKVNTANPINFWDRDGMRVSNSKELATFYNAAVYEGLENGQNLKEALTIASNATTS